MLSLNTHCMLSLNREILLKSCCRCISPTEFLVCPEAGHCIFSLFVLSVSSYFALLHCLTYPRLCKFTEIIDFPG